MAVMVSHAQQSHGSHGKLCNSHMAVICNSHAHGSHGESCASHTHGSHGESCASHTHGSHVLSSPMNSSHIHSIPIEPGTAEGSVAHTADC